MKTLLYATDCTEHAKSALCCAYELSVKLGADLVVLNVYDIPPITVSTTRPSKWIEKNTKEEYLALTRAYCSKTLGKDLEEVNTRIEVTKNSSISDGIIAKADTLSVDLVIIGMKDEHSKRGLFAGDIAKALLKKVPSPLLVIPNEMSKLTLENIVYATDLEQDDLFAIKKLATIANPFDAKIFVFHISTRDEYAGKEQMEWFKELLQQHVSYKRLRFDLWFSDHVSEELKKYLQKVDADMLGMLEREHTGWRKLFHKDLVKKMGSQIKIPLMSFNMIAKDEILNPFKV
ncbi:universal stress protein [Sungkyunkwania multivorans]|uniref:Universal stress protein n=1 Tax=Sungkyunkwania multivorans TaxID=1173618 RepID=A0ABW3D142_9FLAO